MKKYKRILISIVSFILSLPAFFAIFGGLVMAYMLATLGGYRGSLLDSFILITSSREGLTVSIAVVLGIFHIMIFSFMLIRFSRGMALSMFSQVYCLSIVIMAILEKDRLLIVGGEFAAFFWFGLLSLPHVICLVLIIIINNNESKKNMPQFLGAVEKQI